uniref:Uncharacterized protein n=1 Tax=Panagrolaimus sp. ES5 TaxID=591445 RepID=A0AC34FMA1_9BILA
MSEINGYDFDNRGELILDDKNVIALKESNKHFEVELLNGELKFQMCTSECRSGKVVLCFESDVPNTMEDSRQCRSNQCEFQAGFSRDTGELLAIFFKANSPINEGCDTVTMKSPGTKFFDISQSSCNPKDYYDGKVVKMYVKQATPDCFARIVDAREWTPPTSTAPLITSRNPPSNAKESSISEETLWIIIAVVVVLLVIILVCAGFWGYRYWKQKKTVTKTDGKKKLPDLKIAET